MNISKHACYFHDGLLIDISHAVNRIALSMWSAKVEPEAIKYDIPLSFDNRLKGKLHVEGIKSIIINNERLNKKLKNKI